jgi:hypothetical protein
VTVMRVCGNSGNNDESLVRAVTVETVISNGVMTVVTVMTSDMTMVEIVAVENTQQSTAKFCR